MFICERSLQEECDSFTALSSIYNLRHFSEPLTQGTGPASLRSEAPSPQRGPHQYCTVTGPCKSISEGGGFHCLSRRAREKMDGSRYFRGGKLVHTINSLTFSQRQGIPFSVGGMFVFFLSSFSFLGSACGNDYLRTKHCDVCNLGDFVSSLAFLQFRYNNTYSSCILWVV